jgi:hypothetical protein
VAGKKEVGGYREDKTMALRKKINKEKIIKQ